MAASPLLLLSLAAEGFGCLRVFLLEGLRNTRRPVVGTLRRQARLERRRRDGVGRGDAGLRALHLWCR